MQARSPDPHELPAELTDAVRAAKGSDPLAPVTVVCSSGYSALFVRRVISCASGGGTEGVANVNSLTLDSLVHSLGAPVLALRGLVPASSQVTLEAVRTEALERGGWLGRFVRLPSSLAAVERALVELSRCPPGALEVVGSQSAQASEMVGLVGAVRRRLRTRGIGDESDLAEAAVSAADQRTKRRSELGPVLSWGLGKVPYRQAAVLEHLGSRTIRDEPGLLIRTPTLDAVCACPDPEEEARSAARLVLGALEQGVALWRQAIVHPPSGGYARIIHEQLSAADVASNGPGFRRLASTAAARALLGLLDLSMGDFARDDLMAWLSIAPISDGPRARLVPAVDWDVESAAAGVVRGADQWKERLGRHAEGQHARHSDRASSELTSFEATPSEPGPTPTDRTSRASLKEFVTGLFERLGPPGRSWGEHSAWAVGLLDHYLRVERTPDPWPSEQLEAMTKVRDIADSLKELDAVSSGTDVSTFAQTLRARLEREPIELRDQEGRGGFGDGVFVAPFGAAGGLRFAQVVACGLGDSIVPGDGGIDSLLAEDARAADTSGTLRTRARVNAELHEDLLRALGAGRKRIATFARSDPRTGRSDVPSRWLDELSSNAQAIPLASFAASLAEGGAALSLQELELRALDRWRSCGGDVARSPVAQADKRLIAGFGAIRSRAGATFTRFDGLVGAGTVSPFDPDTPVSATRLETYAHCPRRYLFERVLRIERRILPEELWQMVPIERGSLVHSILEQYVAERVGGAPRSLDRLLEIANEQMDRAEDSGLVGKPLLWRVDRAAILRDLRRLHVEEGNLTPVAAELSFGTSEDDAPSVTVKLEDGREVRFRGSADRVDRSPMGRLVVSDYKTGRQNGLRDLSKDPVAGGKLLQLPLYALAARERFGYEGPIRARYWLVSSERSAPFYNLPLTEEVEARFREVISRIATGIEGGCFPGTPGPPIYEGRFRNCSNCDFDRMCPLQRDRQWSRKLGDPVLADVVGLVQDDPGTRWANVVVRGFVDPDADYVDEVDVPDEGDVPDEANVADEADTGDVVDRTDREVVR
jgi:ATP-dependent helicase/nuclease subunit B